MKITMKALEIFLAAALAACGYLSAQEEPRPVCDMKSCMSYEGQLCSNNCHKECCKCPASCNRAAHKPHRKGRL